MRENLPSIHDLLEQPPLFEFEGFIIRPLDPWNVFLEHPNGSGTQLRKQHLLGWFIRLFEEAM